jgi:hypothetical protein
MLIVEFDYKKYAFPEAALSFIQSALEVEEKFIGSEYK